MWNQIYLDRFPIVQPLTCPWDVLQEVQSDRRQYGCVAATNQVRGQFERYSNKINTSVSSSRPNICIEHVERLTLSVVAVDPEKDERK